MLGEWMPLTYLPIIIMLRRSYYLRIAEFNFGRIKIKQEKQ